jgi:hypothetical protein
MTRAGPQAAARTYRRKTHRRLLLFYYYFIIGFWRITRYVASLCSLARWRSGASAVQQLAAAA